MIGALLALAAASAGMPACDKVSGPYTLADAEVSNMEYAAFLNAVARSDPYRLYNPLMSEHFMGGISRSGVSGSYSYAAKAGFNRLPVNFVSWSDAARYANWLGFHATERGSYDLAARHPVRSTSAVYVLPTCAEWRTAVLGKPLGNIAASEGWRQPFPHLTQVDGQQFGNVSEWSESRSDDARLILGGSVFMSAAGARSTSDAELPDHELATIGIRLAKLPRTATRAADPGPPKWVKVGDPGNAGDENGRGAVGYVFEIARTEVTNAEYAEFLNATARVDRYGLYRNDMGTGIGGGIDRLGPSGAFRYVTKPGWGERSVNYLTWFALARMANWYHYGRPRTGRSEAGTTEGDGATGAYDTRAFDRTAFDRSMLHRNPGARYFIPTDDEWVKAAYQGADGRFWKYPFQSDISEPGSSNSISGERMGEGPPFYVSQAGAYAHAPSFWGTVQQGGNLWEWTEDWRPEGECWRCDELTKGIRGGSFNYTWRGLDRANIDPATPEQAYFVFGGRLARMESGWKADTDRPGPSSARWAIWVLAAATAMLALLALTLRRRRRKPAGN
jgi:formylglycine-generating enzyme required for sulfatase activity